MEFTSGVAFAVLGVMLLTFWRCDAAAVILAYGGASLVCVVGASYWCAKAWATARDERPATHEASDAGQIWSKLLPFSAWILLTNVLSNLFGYADRYMILHFAPGGDAERLATVGQYHSARVVPLLLASLATMISVILLPHLSHDWEAGRRERLTFRLNLFLKLATLGLFAAGTAVLAIAPLIFNVAFRGKFAGGSAALPGMLVATVWFGAAAIAQQYMVCAERVGLAALTLGIGLAVNVAINALLLPTLGLTSAVMAAMAANLTLLLCTVGLSRRLGFRLARGTWLLFIAPVSLYVGLWASLAALAAVSLIGLRSELIFTRADKEKLTERFAAYRYKLFSSRAMSSDVATMPANDS